MYFDYSYLSISAELFTVKPNLKPSSNLKPKTQLNIQTSNECASSCIKNNCKAFTYCKGKKMCQLFTESLTNSQSSADCNLYTSKWGILYFTIFTNFIVFFLVNLGKTLLNTTCLTYDIQFLILFIQIKENFTFYWLFIFYLYREKEPITSRGVGWSCVTFTHSFIFPSLITCIDLSAQVLALNIMHSISL